MACCCGSDEVNGVFMGSQTLWLAFYYLYINNFDDKFLF